MQNTTMAKPQTKIMGMITSELAKRNIVERLVNDISVRK